MNNSKGIFKSSKVINTEADTKKVKLQACISSKNIEMTDENNPVTDKHWLFSVPKYMRENKPETAKSIREGSSKTIKSKRCLKKSHDCEQEEECKSTKSIKFKDKVDSVFQYNLTVRTAQRENSKNIKVAHTKQKVREECCEIY